MEFCRKSHNLRTDHQKYYLSGQLSGQSCKSVQKFVERTLRLKLWFIAVLDFRRLGRIESRLRQVRVPISEKSQKIKVVVEKRHQVRFWLFFNASKVVNHGYLEMISRFFGH